MIRVFDIECDELLDKVTKIHCLSYYEMETGISKSFTNYEDIKALFKENHIWVGHNIIKYDFLVLKKLLDIKIPEFCIDTLPISWYLYPERRKHGLEEYGEELGVNKPKIGDWSNLSQEDYVHRCQEDVKINTLLWKKQKTFLDSIYQDKLAVRKFLEYLHFKMDCIREQEEIGLQLDTEYCSSNLDTLESEKESKVQELEKAMPKVPVKKTKKYQNAAIDPSGNVFTKGDLFYEAVKYDSKLVVEHEISKIIDWNDPNSSSSKQIKDWLYSLGWVPEHIKHVRDKKTNETKKIPQIASKEGARDGTGDICESIKKLYSKEPKLEILEGLSVVSHRVAILHKFLEDQKEGILYPSAAGLANTLRLKHKVIVNLPAVEKKYGKIVRGCIIAKPGNALCNSDLTNIEDRTKRHYIYKYDPKYVEDMNTPGYDAHLNIATLAGFMTEDDVEFYKNFDKSKEDKERYSKLKAIRNKSKIANFSCTYKIGADALARNSGLKLKEAKKLLATYWQRNKAILQIEEDTKIRTVEGTQWLFNPTSGFWYSLRNDKDKFSTLNQSTAVYCFDTWLKHCRKAGIKVGLQYHDEMVIDTPKGKEDYIKNIINKAMELTNEELKLNVQMGCSVEFGHRYSEVH
jgi:DNA polymerase I-like protein with 3'-5' exonuclease and polymerase domains